MSVFRTPGFWYRRPDTPAGRLENALTPLSYVYGALQKRKGQKIVPQAASGPVVCVGNIVAGGSGKTPSVLALYALAVDTGLAKSPHILTRGYGGRMPGPIRVDPAVHTARDVGDEPILMATRGAKVIVSRDRVAGAKMAFAHGADLVLMDDGFQNPALKKDLSLLVIDGAAGFGNRRMLPAGPLREQPDEAFARAQAVILIGYDSYGVRDELPDGFPVFTAKIAARGQPDTSFPFIAFAGLGRPEKFRATLVSHGVRVVRFHPFADHHVYTPLDLQRLRDEARQVQAKLITTEKDYMRLTPEQREGIEVLPVALTFDEPDWVERFLRAKLNFEGRNKDA